MTESETKGDVIYPRNRPIHGNMEEDTSLFIHSTTSIILETARLNSVVARVNTLIVTMDSMTKENQQW